MASQARGGDAAAEQQIRSALDRRLEALADDPETPLFFGRLDKVNPAERFYIGRRHVHDDAGDPVVIDWRAEVSIAFYRATHATPMDVALRRRFGYEGGRITAYEDEHLIDPGEADQRSRILAREIERPRVGPMRDIVATIQPEQDVIVRAEFSQTMCVQGAPGTGKTAVGLHRVAYLLFAHRERLRRSGVLVVGPSTAFLAYIAHVLPALGEVDVRQVTVEQLVAHVPVTAEDSSEVAALKGDARMSTVLRRAVYRQLRSPTMPLVLPRGARRWQVSVDQIEMVMDELRQRDVRYGACRSMFAQRLAQAVLAKMETAGHTTDDRVLATMARSAPVRATVDALWPRIDPHRLVMSLFSDAGLLAEVAEGVFSPQEQAALRWQKPPKALRSARWSLADATLIDELEDLVERQPSLGHVVLDEAQDLSPMQLRAVGRRCSTSAATVLGDIAQGTTPWATPDWETTLSHLGKPEAQVEVLRRSYRVPSTVIDFASGLLPVIAPGVPAPQSVPEHEGRLTVMPAAVLYEGVVQAVRAALTDEGSIGVLMADRQVTAISTLLREHGIDHLVESDSGPVQRLALMPVSRVKGLEYDHVVVVEPADIVAGEAHEWQGLRRLYVALTRAVSTLSVVHSEPLPAGLSYPAQLAG